MNNIIAAINNQSKFAILLNMYSKDFFELQIRFVKKVSHITGRPVEELLIKYSSFFKALKINSNWEFRDDDPGWIKYLNFIKDKDITDATYEYYLKVADKDLAVDGAVGCFAYEYLAKDKTVLVHFANKDEAEPGALSKEREPQRLKELKQLFEMIKQKHPEAKKVVGNSWLHNIESYRRLFPKEYYQNTEVLESYRTNSLWGQFLDSSGEVKRDLMEEFLEKLNKVTKLTDLSNCFKYKVLKPSADIKYFYQFYGID